MPLHLGYSQNIFVPQERFPMIVEHPDEMVDTAVVTVTPAAVVTPLRARTATLKAVRAVALLAVTKLQRPFVNPDSPSKAGCFDSSCNAILKAMLHRRIALTSSPSKPNAASSAIGTIGGT